MGHPVALLEVDCVQRPRPATPVIGAAAEEAQPARFQRGIVVAALRSGIEGLHHRIEIRAAGFQQQDVEFGVCQRQRQADARRPAADNGDIGRQHCAGGKRAGVDKGAQGKILDVFAVADIIAAIHRDGLAGDP